jgi:peptide chain release factor 1
MPPQEDPLLKKLDDLLNRWQEISRRMQDPAIASDRTKYVALAREHAELDGIVRQYRAYKGLCDQREQARHILEDPSAEGELKALASAELDDLGRRSEQALDAVKSELVMSEDQAVHSVMLEVRAGTGGEEAALFAADLMGMYRRYSERRGWTFEVLSASPTDLGGLREVIVNVRGEGVWSRLGYEGGGHRVQRVPVTEAQGRIHTSAATVAVLPEPEDIQVQIHWDKDVLEHTSRAGGPGGQSVNKVESAIRLEHVPTGITVSMRDEKSQHKNRAKARRILAARVYEHFHSRQVAAEAAARKAMIGSGDRSQRIRTYNFPQSRCTDHRLAGGGEGGANFNLQAILNGELDELIDALAARDKAQRLANFSLEAAKKQGDGAGATANRGA